MDIKIPHKWLLEFLDTNAKPKEIADFLSLCGPSVERISNNLNDFVYDIEVTTNRVDSAGVDGIAQEASTILPRFGKKAILKPLKVFNKSKIVKKVDYLSIDVDKTLAPRTMLVLIRNVEITDSPQYIQQRIKQVGLRPLNNIIDITNYVMHEVAQPMHVFDYDKIAGHKMVLRKSKKGEKIVTLDGEIHELPGDDIAITDGTGKLIDLPGIMGGENSMIDKNTKNVLLFVQVYDKAKIRRTSMTLSKRSEASSLFEKGLDPEKVELATRRAIDLIEQTSKGKCEPFILDYYPNPYKTKTVSTTHEKIEKLLGIVISKNEIKTILIKLGFDVTWKSNTLSVKIPSSRSGDINIEEDIIEEIARIYGYHNLPSKLMSGDLPNQLSHSPFDFESKLKQILLSLGARETYTLSLVSKDHMENEDLSLSNPLGEDGKYLRDNLLSSLLSTLKENSKKIKINLFEISNIYLSQEGKLPDEKMILAGFITNEKFETTKGFVETLVKKLNIDYNFEISDSKYFLPGGSLFVKSSGKTLGKMGQLEVTDAFYYEFDVALLQKAAKPYSPFKSIDKYPPQIEDLSLTFPDKTCVGPVVDEIYKIDKNIANVEVVESYESSYLIRVHYQNPNKTLTDDEVAKIRGKVLSTIKAKFNIILKS